MEQAIVIYSTASCAPCRRAKDLLARLGLPFREIRVDLDERMRDEMERRSGRITAPQVFVGEDHIGGCDALYAAKESGALDAILARNGIAARTAT